ncbi:MAG: hypothetical protein FD149_1923 [Rhodospirillaceae bacterium]|nr:MAG: hypothetical protein FD149_1923 [Rhodospirillaceae bacterium]
MNRHAIVKGSTVLVMFLSASACQHMEPAPICDMGAIASQRTLVSVPAAVPGGASPLQEMPLNSVSITDHRILNKVYVRNVTARRTPSGTVELYAQVINCTDHPLQTEARTQFYDAGQAPAEPVSAWKRLYLPPRTSNIYREFSLGTTSIHAYMVEMREGE